jgi:hypothetical protein
MHVSDQRAVVRSHKRTTAQPIIAPTFMNRREALKKLAASGAIATGASVVMSSNQVAFAASPPGTGLTGAPANGVPIPITYGLVGNDGKQGVTIGNGANVTCASGSLTVLYGWRINSFTVSANKGLELTNVAGTTVIANQVSSQYSNPNPNFGTVLLRTDNSILKPGDVYSIGVFITWQCSGASQRLEAEYAIAGAWPAQPSVSQVSYNVV